MFGRVAMVAALSASLVGCYAFDKQKVKDGQSHWLGRCSEQSDCEDDETCSCGVCTIACDSSDRCGENGTCEAVGERIECASAPSGAERVCLAACSSSAACGDDQLACVNQACVAVGTGPSDEPDGSLSDGSSRDGAQLTFADGLTNACETAGAFDALEPRAEETCYDLLMHDGDGEEPFRIPLDEGLHQTYYAIPWPVGRIATRFGFRQDDTTSLHRALLFDAVGGSDGLLERNVSGDLMAQDAKAIAVWATGGCNVEMPSELGIELPNPGGERTLLIQWHYYNMTGQEQRDGSRFQICVVPRDSRAFVGSLIILGSEDLGGLEGVPAGQESTYESECLNTVENEDGSDATLVMYMPHMHALGTRSRIDYDLGGGRQVTVLDREFDDEKNVHYMSPPRTVLYADYSLHTSCTYRNDREYSAPYGTSLIFEQCYQFAYAYPAGALERPDRFSLLGATNTCWGD
jgi:hypothetical protein